MKKTLLAAAAALLGLAGMAGAQDFPTKAVTMVIPFPAGAGANDTNGRFLADRLSKLWDQPVVIENRPGGNTTIGAMHVIRSRPDGHTMMFSSANYTMSPAVAPIPFDAATDLKPAAMLGLGEYLLVTGPHNDVKDAREFVELGKQKQLTYSGGTAGADLGSAMFMQAGGIKMKRVPYKGTNDALLDILGGRLDFLVAAVGSQVGNVQEGKVRALAVTGPTRSPQRRRRQTRFSTRRRIAAVFVRDEHRSRDGRFAVHFKRPKACRICNSRLGPSACLFPEDALDD